ncbi:MAG TPA: DUF6596 domain-containing protein [Streptosporangiaceae bacterium]|nr:DUF6596 domain-containing protein [Streptosporangiaceae bacterium]
MLPQQPEAAGLLALLLTDARRAARLDTAGDVVPLPDQDRSRWDRDKIREGRALLAPAARAARPGPYQLHAAIAACHSRATETDWRQVAALYGELARYEPTAVVEANRAVTVAMAEGPVAGLAILDPLEPRLANWPQFHIARAELLRRVGRAAGPGARTGRRCGWRCRGRSGPSSSAGSASCDPARRGRIRRARSAPSPGPAGSSRSPSTATRSTPMPATRPPARPPERDRREWHVITMP